MNEMAREIYSIIKEGIESRRPGYLPGCLIPSYSEARREFNLYYHQWRRVVKKLERNGLITIKPTVSGARGEMIINDQGKNNR